MDVRIVSGGCERALKLTLQGSCVDLCFGAWCPKGTVEMPKPRMECLLWQPGTHSLWSQAANDTSAVGLGSSSASDTGEVGPWCGSVSLKHDSLIFDGTLKDLILGKSKEF